MAWIRNRLCVMAASSCLWEPNCSQRGPCGLDKRRNAVPLLLLHRVPDDLDFPSLGRSWFGQYDFCWARISLCWSPLATHFHPPPLEGLNGCAELPGSWTWVPALGWCRPTRNTQHCASLRHVSLFWDTVILKACPFPIFLGREPPAPGQLWGWWTWKVKPLLVCLGNVLGTENALPSLPMTTLLSVGTTHCGLAGFISCLCIPHNSTFGQQTFYCERTLKPWVHIPYHPETAGLIV